MREARVRESRVTPRAEPRQRGSAAAPGWTDHPMAHTARVGLVSAGLVLAIFAGVLLALALWLP